MKTKFLVFIIFYIWTSCVSIEFPSNKCYASTTLHISAYSRELIEEDEVLQQAVKLWLNAHPHDDILINIEDVNSNINYGDLYIIDNNYRSSHRQLDIFSPQTSDHFINMYCAQIDLLDDLLPSKYILESHSYIKFIPMTIGPTVMQVNEDIWKLYLQDNPLSSIPNTWNDIVDIAKWVKSKKLVDVITVNDWPQMCSTIIFQIDAYLKLCQLHILKFQIEPIINNLKCLKELIELDQIASADNPNTTGIFTIIPALYLSGDDFYVNLPSMSNNIDICPSSSVFVAIRKGTPNKGLAIDFINILLSKECQDVYNIMGVIRKDTSIIPHADYPTFFPPKKENIEIYKNAVNHAAIPFITPEQANTINSLIKSLIEKDDTSEKTASAIIKILQMER